jgi:hypothetical protein
VREPYGDWREEDHDCVPHALDVEISCEHPIHYVDPKPAIAYGDEYYSELKQRQVDNALAMYTNGLIEKRGDEWRRLITDLDRQQGSVTDFKEVDWLAIGIGPFPDSTDLNCIKVKYRVTRNSLVSREILLVCPHQRGADWGISEHEIDAGQLGHLYESGSTFKEEKTILNK